MLKKQTPKRLFQTTIGRYFLVLLALSFFTGVSVFARDSVYTRTAGPKYWIAYEYCYQTDQPLPESRWQANIDWVAANFQPYGYNMCSNDGWIEGSQKVNANGYIISYNDSWTHDWTYWANYLAGKNMKLGIYYDPLWLTANAYTLNCPVQGTSYHARDIVGSTSFNSSLYWVDTDKPGAQEWIKGYVNYFKSVGAKYLRIDFLSWYENAYGAARYEKAIRWMREAAGNDMEISLVMPNLYNHAQNEIPNGDMIRIDEDVFNGGWDHISGRRRGVWQSGWSQWANAFDGFVGFADISGRGQMISDGDFIRLNTVSNDTERKFEVSLFTMAGSPITIADQYDTIGGSAWIYQNTELIDLNNQGFFGKPLSYDPNNVNSQRWIGQLPNGDWVVGLFNRESTSQNRSIDFNADLGISGGSTSNVRDLWAHSDLGSISGSYSVTLAPHDCKIIKVRNNAQKYEAEVASMIGGTKKNTNHLGFSGAGFVDKMETVGAKVLFAVSVPQAGTYSLNIRYANARGVTGTASLYVNDVKKGQFSMPNLANWDSWGTVQQSVSLNTGVNYIAVQYDSGDTAFFNLDYIQLTSSTSTLITINNPGFETGNISGWTEWHPTGQAVCYGVDSNDVHSGSYKCYFWGTSAYDQSIHQLKTGLVNGSYTLKAWVKQNTGTPTICRMELGNYGGSTVYVNIGGGSSYQQVTGTVNITNGQLDIGFYTKSPGNTNLQIDDVELWKN